MCYVPSVSSFTSFQLLMGACDCPGNLVGLLEKTLLNTYPGGCANGWVCSLMILLTLSVSH